MNTKTTDYDNEVQSRRRWQELKKLCAELAIPCNPPALDALFEGGPSPAGLPHAESGRFFSPEQIESRAVTIRNAYKVARQLVMDIANQP